MTPQTLLQVRTSSEGVIGRRTFLRNVAAGAAGLSVLGWKDAVSLHAAELRKQGLACILMFMRGGPSQFETFDPKPGASTGGPTKAIDTSVSGIRIAENWPKLAKVMQDVAIIRSMTNREGEHQRATYQLHTGYAPSGVIKYPTFGAVAAAELGEPGFDLPHFVTIGNRFGSIGSGFLGMSFAPFIVPNAQQMPNNVALPRNINGDRFGRRLNLMKDLEQDFAESGARAKVEEHREIYNGAAQMVLSPRLKAFDLNEEKDTLRDQYGRNPFGQACLLARRLVEQGVTFVEVESNGWDTHADNFNQVKRLSDTIDPAFASLVADLKDRGMLDRTLVIWMGEFGRTPRINGRTGRDHYPRAFNVALAGGGIRGGQTIGDTGTDGVEVKERPVNVADLFCTFCQSLKINPRKEFLTSLGRPIKVVEGGQAVKELFA